MFKGRAPSASSHEGLREQERLTSALVVRQLPPWHEYLRKRQVKSPKVYIRDSGLLHSLLDIRDRRDLLGHPKSGASWEGFAMNQVFAQHVVQPQESYFWATHAGAELDLLVVRRRKRIGFEFKRSSAPELSKSMQIAVKDLRLKHLYVVFPGTEQYKLHAKVTALPLSSLAQARL
ncbi:MAG: hypothetical protein CSA62_01260 [Planctomycetota bacterium]|nr:MAG: hypothetical protein CSA62_01260 [Planctomycetota bacterium]